MGDTGALGLGGAIGTVAVLLKSELLLVVVGAGLWVFMAALLPFLASLPFRPFYPAETWGPIVDYATLAFGAIFLFVLLVVPLIDASRSFSRLRGDSNNAAAGG